MLYTCTTYQSRERERERATEKNLKKKAATLRPTLKCTGKFVRSFILLIAEKKNLSGKARNGEKFTIRVGKKEFIDC